MSISAIDADAVWEYVSQRDPAYGAWRNGDRAAATVFCLRVLTAGEFGEILDTTQRIARGADDKPAIGVDVNRRNAMLVEKSLVGWNNFRDVRGNLVPFQTAVSASGRSHAAPATIERIPYWLIRELAHQVLAANTLSADEVKNSAASSGESRASSNEAVQTTRDS